MATHSALLAFLIVFAVGLRAPDVDWHSVLSPLGLCHIFFMTSNVSLHTSELNCFLTASKTFFFTYLLCVSSLQRMSVTVKILVGHKVMAGMSD